MIRCHSNLGALLQVMVKFSKKIAYLLPIPWADYFYEMVFAKSVFWKGFDVKTQSINLYASSLFNFAFLLD